MFLGKTCKESAPSVLSYIHQHAWLLYTSQALSMTNLLYSPERQLRYQLQHDPDYLKSAAQLHNHSIDLAVQCLNQVTTQDMDRGGYRGTAGLSPHHHAIYIQLLKSLLEKLIIQVPYHPNL